MRRKFSKRWPHYVDFWQEHFACAYENEQSIPDEHTSELLQLVERALNKEHLIFTIAQTVSFRLEVMQHNEIAIIDDLNEVVGFVDEFGERPEILALSEAAHLRNRLDFIPLSLSARRDLNYGMFTHRILAAFRKLGGEERLFYLFGRQRELLRQRDLDLTFFDSSGEPLDPVPLVDVMLIGWENGIAHRIAIGWVLLTKWAKASRQSKLIILE
jgi:hypothetical protein